MSKFIEKILEHDPTLRVASNPYTLEQHSEVFGRVITGKEILERVTAYLIKKGLREKIEQGEYNSSSLGGIQFWINNIKNSNKSVIRSELKFSSSYDQWSFEAILMSLEEAERAVFIQDGANIDVNYKPVNR